MEQNQQIAALETLAMGQNVEWEINTVTLGSYTTQGKENIWHVAVWCVLLRVGFGLILQKVKAEMWLSAIWCVVPRVGLCGFNKG